MQIITQDIIHHFLKLMHQKGIENHAVSIRQNGKILFENAMYPYEKENLHPVYSITKSFTSMAIGFLEDAELINIDDYWLDYFPEFQSVVADNTFKDVKIRHLLTMSLGQDSDIELTKEDDWVISILDKEIAYQPGSVFFYKNNDCSHLLSALVEKLTGMSMKQYLKEKLFEPLNIKEYYWEDDLNGRTMGGYGLHLTIHDLGKFGQCCLDNGRYNKKQVIPEKWIKKATTCQMQNASEYAKNRSENRQGYGLHFWMCTHAGYRCSGLHGQLCFIQPTNNLVVSMFNAASGSQELLDCLFEAMEDQIEVEKEKSFNLLFVEGDKHSHVIEPYLNHKMIAHDNYFGLSELMLELTDDILTIVLKKNDKQYQIKAAYREWYKQNNSFRGFNSFMFDENIIKQPPSFVELSASANFAWHNKTTLVIDIRESDHSCGTRLTLGFDKKHIVLYYAVKGLYTQITETKCIFK